MSSPKAFRATSAATDRDPIDDVAGKLHPSKLTPNQFQVRHDPVAHAVDCTLGRIMDGIHAARRQGYCPVCDAPIPSPYLQDESAPRLDARERERRRVIAHRVSAILRGDMPR
jgi:hypothetical protein